MAETTLFSVIIPTYNRAGFIRKAIESVFAQSYSHFELIVVDDGSTDNTLEVLSSISHPNFKFISNPNMERAAARNTGARTATGDYLNFFDSDDILLPNHLEVAANAIKELGGPEFLHLNFEFRDAEDRVLRKGKKHGIGTCANNDLIEGNPFSCNGVFLRRDVALNFPFNEDRGLSASEDYELWIRLGSRYCLHTVDTVTSIIFSHEGRSVLNVNLDKLIKRKELLLKYAFEDPAVKKRFGKKRKQITAFCETYIALHLVLGGMVGKGLRYLLNGILLHPACLNDRRILGIVKHSLLQLIPKNETTGQSDL